jgi:site-specific recombinase XerD
VPSGEIKAIMGTSSFVWFRRKAEQPPSFNVARGRGTGRPPANKGKRYPAQTLTRDELNRLLAACSRRGSAGVRDRALIVVLWRGGLRVAEALALQLHDVNFERGTIRVLHGKGDQARTIGIDPQALAVIEAWVARRRDLGIGPSRPLFCTFSQPRPGKGMHPQRVRESLKRLAVKAGIEHRVHPHGLRHTHAAELANEGVPVHVIRRQLGHNSLDTTARYIDHLTPQDVIATMRGRSWEPPVTHRRQPPIGVELAELERASATGAPAGV